MGEERNKGDFQQIFLVEGPGRDQAVSQLRPSRARRDGSVSAIDPITYSLPIIDTSVLKCYSHIYDNLVLFH